MVKQLKSYLAAFMVLLISETAYGTQVQLFNNNDEIKLKSVNVVVGGGYVHGVHNSGQLQSSAIGYMDYISSIFTIVRPSSQVGSLLKIRRSRINRSQDYYLTYQHNSVHNVSFTDTMTNAHAFHFVPFPIGTGLNFTADPVFLRLKHLPSGKFLGARGNGHVVLLPADPSNQFVNPGTLFYVHKV